MLEAFPLHVPCSSFDISCETGWAGGRLKVIRILRRAACILVGSVKRPSPGWFYRVRECAPPGRKDTLNERKEFKWYSSWCGPLPGGLRASKEDELEAVQW
jgi:hypothetical protein